MSGSATPAALDGDSANLLEILQALQIFNSNAPHPYQAPRQLAAQLDARGETVESMEWAFAWCQQNTLNPVKAFYLWMQSGQLLV